MPRYQAADFSINLYLYFFSSKSHPFTIISKIYSDLRRDTKKNWKRNANRICRDEKDVLKVKKYGQNKAEA